jgi:hypothetical protein
MKNSHLGRRGFLKALAGAAGAAAGHRLAGRGWIAPAQAAAERSVLVTIYLNGGYNACFPSADSFQNIRFGVNDGNVMPLGNGLVVDRATLGSLTPFARSHMASIGVYHGISDHGAAHGAMLMSGGRTGRSYALRLAAAMGGDGAIKAPLLGYGLDGYTTPTPEGSISLQQIRSMKATIDALGGGAPNPRAPSRAIALSGVTAARAMSSARLDMNPSSLGTLREGYVTALETLKKPPAQISFADVATAYGHPVTDTDVTPFGLRNKIVAAELMIHAGANVISIVDHVRSLDNWDSHGSVDAQVERNLMQQRLIPLLNTFLSRVLELPDLNVVVVIMGDFSRSPANDHARNLTATVMGKYVKVGTTGRVNDRVQLQTGAPGPQQFWAYLAKALKVPTEPFGPDPHGLIA